MKQQIKIIKRFGKGHKITEKDFNDIKNLTVLVPVDSKVANLLGCSAVTVGRIRACESFTRYIEDVAERKQKDLTHRLDKITKENPIQVHRQSKAKKSPSLPTDEPSKPLEVSFSDRQLERIANSLERIARALEYQSHPMYVSTDFAQIDKDFSKITTVKPPKKGWFN